jgi:prepilin-type N-terminal cleavage/methylation domain-containing protein/prepilin-type processing-associated H-X9-DG protein
MKRQSGSFTLVEMLVVIAIVGILAGILLPSLMTAREQSRRKTCMSNLSQIGKACISYLEPNGDFFPAFAQQIITGANSAIPTSGQGMDGAFQPMPSLACLYPTYCTEVKIFACPSTTDVPQIAFHYYNVTPNVSVLHTCFGFASYDSTGALINSSDPAAYTTQEVRTPCKCSYLYDELVQPRDCTAEQAIAADADGQTWFVSGSQHPTYPGNWQRRPSKPNHDNGQNVMYLDGHVKWTDAVYCSHDPLDNIFCPNSAAGAVQWNADIDAYLWDGLNARAVQAP